MEKKRSVMNYVKALDVVSLTLMAGCCKACGSFRKRKSQRGDAGMCLPSQGEYLMTQNPYGVNGLVKTISDNLLKSSIREYPTFAVATAMQAVASAAMGTWTLPDGRPLCLYQLLLAPASAGKGAYIGGLKNLLLKTAEPILASEPGSREGLRRGLLEWNARLLCIDEVQDFFAKLADDNPHIAGIGIDLKEIWSGVGKLQSIVTKTVSSHAVVAPIAGFYGSGTVNETAQHFSGSVAGGGLVSRFCVFVETDVVPAKRDIERATWEVESGKLYRIFHGGKTDAWRLRGAGDWFEYRKQLLEPKAKIEGPQVRPTKRLNIHQAAADALWEQRKLWESALLDDASSASAAIFDRAATNALIYAGCHAIGMESGIITMEDINVGIDLARVSAEHATKLSNDYGGETALDKDAKKILRQLEQRGPLTKRELSQYANLNGKRLMEPLGGLIASGNVISTMGKFSKS